MIKATPKKLIREKKHWRMRNRIKGTAERPRLAVFRSNQHIYAQIIDDVAGNTLVAVSTLDKAIKTKKSNVEAAKEVGALIAKRAAAKNIKTVVNYRKSEKRV